MDDHAGIHQDERALKEKIFLKQSARKELQFHIKILKSCLSLQKLDKGLKKQLSHDFNPLLALQVDAVRFLLKSLAEGSGPSKSRVLDGGGQ